MRTCILYYKLIKLFKFNNLPKMTESEHSFLKKNRKLKNKRDSFVITTFVKKSHLKRIMNYILYLYNY